MTAEALDKSYTIVPMTVADTDNMLAFLRCFFFKDEPMNTYLQLGECKELESWSAKYLKENCSFKAINSDGEIIGIILNGIIPRRVGPPQQDDGEICKHEKFRKILGIFDYIETQYNMFDLHPGLDRALDAKIMSVNNAYRGAGICKELTLRTAKHMQENNIKLFHVMCSSFYSAKVCERLGFELEYTLPFKNYVVDGVSPLLPADPHVSIKCYTKMV